MRRIIDAQLVLLRCPMEDDKLSVDDLWRTLRCEHGNIHRVFMVSDPILPYTCGGLCLRSDKKEDNAEGDNTCET